MGQIIAIANQKGGVGKTTTTANIGFGLAQEGKKVLLIDFDPQGDLTTSLGWNNTELLEYTISDLVDSVIKGIDFDYSKLIKTHVEGVDLIPSNIELSNFEMKVVNEIGRETILSTSLNPLKSRYDYILIDCPPSLGLMTINALATANKVLIPVQAQYLPAKGMTMFLQTVSKVQRKINPELKIAGIAITLANMKTNIARSTVDQIRENFEPHIKVFKSIIPSAVKASEACVSGKSLYTYAKDSKVAEAYHQLTKEILKIEKQQIKKKTSYIR